MKKIFILFLLLFSINENQAQKTQAVSNSCLLFDDFDGYCGTDLYLGGICPYSFFSGTGTCAPRSEMNASGVAWYISHGTPQIKQVVLGQNAPSNYVLMWFDPHEYTGNSYGAGEGIYTPFSFMSNNTYLIKVKMLASSGNGNLEVRAATGLIELPPENCGNAIPYFNISSSLIGGQPANNSTYVEYPFYYTPIDNIQSSIKKYSQIWIYPYTTTDISDYYQIYVDNVSICTDCNGVITYNSGTVPYGDTKAGSIYAGSSTGTGGSGIVSINSSQITNLLAYNTIELDPDFKATITGTGSFTADIINCPTGGQSFAKTESSNISGLQKKIISKSKSFLTDSINLQLHNLIIFPNPVSSTLNLHMNNQMQNVQAIRVLNALGNVVKVVSEAANLDKQNLSVDMSKLSSGIYFIQVQTKSEIITQKFVKN